MAENISKTDDGHAVEALEVVVALASQGWCRRDALVKMARIVGEHFPNGGYLSPGILVLMVSLEYRLNNDAMARAYADAIGNNS